MVSLGTFRFGTGCCRSKRRHCATCILISHVDILAHTSCIANAIPASNSIQADGGVYLHHILWIYQGHMRSDWPTNGVTNFVTYGFWHNTIAAIKLGFPTQHYWTVSVEHIFKFEHDQMKTECGGSRSWLWGVFHTILLISNSHVRWSKSTTRCAFSRRFRISNFPVIWRWFGHTTSQLHEIALEISKFRVAPYVPQIAVIASKAAWCVVVHVGKLRRASFVVRGVRIQVKSVSFGRNNDM